MKILSIITFVCCLSFSGVGQNAMKQTKQQSSFFYTQLNLHGGYIHDINGGRWDVTNRSPKNQLAFQLFTINQKRMQKGYVKTLSLSASKLRFSIPFDKTVNQLGQREANFKFQLLDTWLKFDTKWDRTNLWFGNKSIPYGHNPKLDPVSSFMTNLIKMDIGFVQDFGVFLKTPISNKLDMELAITSGGMLNKPILVCDNLIDNNENEDLNPTFSFSNYSYDNTFLVTSHIGSPTFKKNEFGLNIVSGRINNTLVNNDIAFINRVGGDWIYKLHEKFRVSNQVTFGHTESEAEGGFAFLNYQGSVDVYIINKMFVSSSFAVNYLNSVYSKDLYHLNNTSATSLTYSFSPHTRIRLNHFYSSIKEADEKRWGLLLQFVTGIGKRP